MKLKKLKRYTWTPVNLDEIEAELKKLQINSVRYLTGYRPNDSPFTETSLLAYTSNVTAYFEDYKGELDGEIKDEKDEILLQKFLRTYKHRLSLDTLETLISFGLLAALLSFLLKFG